MKKARRYTEEEARAMLLAAIRRAGSQAAFADSHGIARGYLTDVLKGRKGMAGKILDALGLQRIVEFQCSDEAASPKASRPVRG